MRIVGLLIGLVLIVAGALFPLWYIAFAGLLLISALMPFLGVPAGFLLDVIFGLPPIIPEVIGYPFMFAAVLIGILSFVLRRYLR